MNTTDKYHNNWNTLQCKVLNLVATQVITPAEVKSILLSLKPKFISATPSYANPLKFPRNRSQFSIYAPSTYISASSSSPYSHRSRKPPRDQKNPRTRSSAALLSSRGVEAIRRDGPQPASRTSEYLARRPWEGFACSWMHDSAKRPVTGPCNLHTAGHIWYP